MTGHEFTQLVASYIVHNFAQRGIEVYPEVPVGKSIIGKNRRVDLLLLDRTHDAAFAVECKYQDSQGTVDEKIPYTLNDLASLQMEGALVYAGDGFSTGVQHMLQSSELAAYCLPDPDNLSSSTQTRELDHYLAMHFKWWDILVRGKQPFPGC